MAKNTRSALTTYSTMGAYGGEVIGTNNSGTAAQGNSNLDQSGGALSTDFQPDKNMTNIIWNSSFRNAANWSAGNGASGGAGPGGTGNAPGCHGSGANWNGILAGGSTATATATIDISNVIAVAVVSGGSSYNSAPTVTISGGSGVGATAVAVIVDGVVTAVTMTSQGSGYSSMDSIIATIASPGDPNVFGDEHELTLHQPVSSVDDSAYHSGIPIDGSNNPPVPTDMTSSGTQWNTEGQEDIWVHIKFTLSGSGSSDPIHLKVGNAADATTWGTFKILPEELYAVAERAGGHTAGQGVVYSSGGTYHWVGKVESVASSEGANIFFTLVSGGASGRSYTFKHIEAYVRNHIKSPVITRTPSGNITLGDTISATIAETDIDFTGDFVDESLGVSIWDFEYNGSSHVTDATASWASDAFTAAHTYAASLDEGRYTVRAEVYLSNTNAYYTFGSSYAAVNDIEYVTVMPINMAVSQFSSDSSARNFKTSEADGAYVVSTLGIWENGEQTTNPFFIYENLRYRIETTEPISEFYIDWDDGEDNSPEKANFQSIILEEPQFFATCDHVYTTYGTHYPIVRAKNIDGFWSKYYTAYEDAGTDTTYTLTAAITTTGPESGYEAISVSDNATLAINDVIRIGHEYMKVASKSTGVLNVQRGYLDSDKLTHASSSKIFECAGVNQNDYSGIENTDVGSGQNRNSLVSIDHISTHKLPVFRPANKPPVAILKTDRTRILSGIQNELLSASGKFSPSDIYVDVTGNSSTGSASAQVKITYESRLEGSTDQNVLSSTKYGAQTISDVAKILKVELINMKEVTTTTDGALKAGERVTIRKGDVNGYAICYVSLGNPIVSENDVAYNSILDLSESKTRASNLDISNYYIDDGHHITGSTRHNPVTTDIESESGDETGNVLNSNFLTYYPNLIVQYSFQDKLDPIGTDGRYLSKEILCRGQVQDNSSTLRKNHAPTSGDTISLSYLDHDEHLVYRNKGGAGTTPPRPASLCSSHLIIGSLTRHNPDWTDLSEINKTGARASAQFLLGGGHNSTTARTPGGTAHTNRAQNYIFMTRRDKFDKVYIKTYNDYIANPPTMSGTTTIPEYTITLYYPTKNNSGEVHWKALPYTDTTKYENVESSSLMRDGSLIFRPPLDWHKGVSADIYGSGGDTDHWDFGQNFDSDSGGGSDVGPEDVWTSSNGSSYGLMICVSTDGGHDNTTRSGISYIKPYNNTHSQVLTLLDPTHVSLNTKTLTQSISFNRQGKFNILTSRLGKAEIRRISANNGSVTFGGVDFPSDTTRKDMKDYQQASTPVYLDIEHRNGDSTRFYGIIESMSESHAAGKMTPKFSLKMTVSHIIEFDSTGTLLSNGYISLGGSVDYESEYIQ